MKYYGGIDLGGTNVKIGLLNENGELIFETSIKTNANDGADKVISRVCSSFKEKVEEFNVDYNKIVSVGVGIPGPVVNKRIIKVFANLPWGSNLDVAEIFEKYLGKKVYLDNDVNVITLGETWVGAAKSYENVLGLAVGTGVGAGIVANGKIISGKIGAAGEFGHIKIVKNGLLCGCGQKGCLEAYSSATGIIRNAESRLKVSNKTSLYEIYKKRALEAKDVFDEAKKGDAMALDIVEETAESLAYGISFALNLLDTQIVVIGGGVSLAGDFLFDKIKKYLPKYTFSVILEDLEIKRAVLGNDSGIYGAAYLAMLEEK